MKKVIMSILIVATVLTTGFSQNKETSVIEKRSQNLKKETIGVRGNCGMCKSTIEKTAKAVEGVSDAVWDRAHKAVIVSFDASITSALEIQKAIAKSGYDTESVKANDLTYNELPGCCQYDRDMKMNISENRKL